MTVTCVNPECSENGIVKGMAPGATPPPDDIIILCGVCGDPCEKRTDPLPEPKEAAA